jgi:hypothetical protein
MRKLTVIPTPKTLTDEQVLDEFVRRFHCQGAVLIYLDENIEYGFGRWTNPPGRQWVNSIFNDRNSNLPIIGNCNEIRNNII